MTQRPATADALEPTRLSARLRDALPVVAWLGALLVAIWLFTLMGGGRLSTPSILDPGSWPDWARDRDVVEATMAVLRLVVLALAWYLVGVLTIGAAARLLRSARLIKIADVLTVPLVRRSLEQALGLTLATAVATSAAAGGAAPAQQRDAPTMAAGTTMTLAVDDDATSMALERMPDAEEAGVAIGDGDATLSLALERMMPQAASLSLRLESSDPVDSLALQRLDTTTTHDVVAGEHLWSIASAQLEARGLASDDASVDAYVDAIVTANRDRLVDPANPDLILPGQQFVLPTPSGTDT